MTFQKPKTNHTHAAKQPSAEDLKKVMEAAVTTFMEKNESKRKHFEKIDDNISKVLNSNITYYYYLLSLTTACIGFAISVTLHQKIGISDSLIIISICLWMTSFKFGIDMVLSKISMISYHGFYIQAETLDSKEMADDLKKKFDDMLLKNKNLKKNPLFYFTLGILSFMIWYIIKICTS